MNIKRFKKSQKIRVIISGVCIYTTVKSIRDEFLLGYMKQNVAANRALEALEYIRAGSGAADKSTKGLCGVWENIDIQLDMV
jgi:hypothetical protein